MPDERTTTNGHGGKRAGAGRPRGSKSKRTLAREQMIAEAEQAVRATLTPDQLASMTSLDVLRYAMRAHVVSGNLSVAAEIAARLAPYEHARIAVMVDQVAAADTRAATIRAIAGDTDPEFDNRGTGEDRKVSTA